ncbi:DNA helicase UvrD [Candidatus Berkelbacteria bacterium RBG_13_40_8]|uniref:DNA helicase UvrD n=1 Tax=Candidatus Berkelbacteria bacterium RBG_13_40_8 TaxID=1797467 RepID=A0A1F5DN13_9BACT|nr:MAG: DNA helicase UvrD [Candidatus Berkelbacteria bacterium RBG_13_40_8]
MRIIADFHIHSKYSRATSRDMDLPHITEWAKYKGIDIIGTGDFTHPLWLAGIKKELTEDGSGLLHRADDKSLKFILTGEISNIYTQGGKVRKVHTIVFVPDIQTAQTINDRLTRVGNLYSDGRPILGLSAKDLAQIILDINPKSLIVPAHVWTPWFSIFGSNSGFDSLKESYGELTPYINSIETGLSSDPEMNWRLSSLDKIALISNSDAHSPANLGREANVFEIDENKLSYHEIVDILQSKDKKRFPYTIEFYPEEGKYHFDGHRNCNLVVNPFEQKYPENRCPVCGKKLTIGVMNRVEELADRSSDYRNDEFPSSKHLVPLMEVIAESLESTTSSQKVRTEYLDLVNRFNGEFNILLDMDEDALDNNLHPKITDGIKRVRNGNIHIEPGYDGVYGKVKVFGKEKEQQRTLF